MGDIGTDECTELIVGQEDPTTTFIEASVVWVGVANLVANAKNVESEDKFR